jgi:hypothetical protein
LDNYVEGIAISVIYSKRKVSGACGQLGNGQNSDTRITCNRSRLACQDRSELALNIHIGGAIENIPRDSYLG